MTNIFNILLYLMSNVLFSKIKMLINNYNVFNEIVIIFFILNDINKEYFLFNKKIVSF